MRRLPGSEEEEINSLLTYTVPLHLPGSAPIFAWLLRAFSPLYRKCQAVRYALKIKRCLQGRRRPGLVLIEIRAPLKEGPLRGETSPPDSAALDLFII